MALRMERLICLSVSTLKSVKSLVQTFVQAEDSNFQLFNYVNELSGEIEKLDLDIDAVRKEIENYKNNAAEATDKERKKILSELSESIETNKLQGEQYEAKYHGANRSIASLRLGIQTIYDRLGCNMAENNQLLLGGGSAGVSESNMMQYLGIIEAKTNQLVQTYHELRKEEEQDRQLQSNQNDQNQDSNQNQNGNQSISNFPTSPLSQSKSQVQSQSGSQSYRSFPEEEEEEDEGDNGDDENQSSFSSSNSEERKNRNKEEKITINLPSTLNETSATDGDDDDDDDQDGESVVNTELLRQQAAERLRRDDD